MLRVTERKGTRLRRRRVAAALFGEVVENPAALVGCYCLPALVGVLLLSGHTGALKILNELVQHPADETTLA